MSRHLKWQSIFLVVLAVGAAVASEPNVLDQSLEQRLAKNKLPHPIIDDMTFIRRTWLDITGNLPYQSFLDEWLAQPGPLDRDMIVAAALDSRLYQSRWATYFETMFDLRHLTLERKSYRYSFRSVIREFLQEDQGWDGMARKLITHQGSLTDDSSLYAAWHQGSGTDNTLIQDIFDDQAAYLSEKLLGIQMRCISCHDGANHLEKVNVDLTSRKRRDFWALAAFLSTGTLFCPEDENCFTYGGILSYLYLDYVQTDDPAFEQGGGIFIPEGYYLHDGAYVAESEPGEGMRPPRNGGAIEPRYPFTGETPQPGETRRQALARIMTADRQFARNMVNRLWHHFVGTPLIWPYEDFDLARLDAATAREHDTTVQPSDPDMLELLTDLFIAGDYRLKPFIRTLCGSRLYQLDYAKLPPRNQGAYWGGPLRFRRLEPEAVVTAIEWAASVQPAYLSSSGSFVQRNPWDFLLEEPKYDFGRNVPQAIRSYGIETAEELYDHQKALSDFMLGMGRGSRSAKLPPKENLDQEALLYLMNAKWVLNEILDESPIVDDLFDQWQTNQIDADQVVTRLFLRSLWREPTEAELAANRSHLTAEGTRAAVADILWATFNTADFLYR